MNHSQPDGYLAVPPTGSGSAVLVLHAWWGLNETMMDFCNQLAGQGFIAFAPDLYHGTVVSTIKDAEEESNKLDNQQASADIGEAVTYLRDRFSLGEQRLAVVGFSLGAYYALQLSVTHPQQIHKVVIFYGTGPGDFSSSKAAYLGHFAQNDEYEPGDYVMDLESALQQAGRPVTFHRYAGTGHWFFEPDRREAYNQQAAKLAWERTLGFLRSSLPPETN